MSAIDTMGSEPPNTISVIGAGIVGLCCALTLQNHGHRVTLVDPAPPGSQTSAGNAGAIAVTEVLPLSVPGILWEAPKWLLDPSGPLTLRWQYLPQLAPWFWRFIQAGSKANVARIVPVLTHLLASVYKDYDALLHAAGLTHCLHKGGALTLYHRRASYQAAASEWAIKREQGVRFETVSPEDIRQLEPDLAPIFEVGVRNLDWGHVDDPQQLCTGLFDHFIAQGGTYQPTRVADFLVNNQRVTGLQLADGQSLHCDKVVVAAGVWSRDLLKPLGCRISLESERGYHMTFANPQATLNNMIIAAEGKFVMTPMSMGLRVAGTAEFAGLNASPNYRRSEVLMKQAKTLIPNLNLQQPQRWAGHRPATPDSLPVIGTVPGQPNVYCAFGHGHLGLTLGPTTGRLLAQLVAGEPLPPVFSALRVDRF